MDAKEVLAFAKKNNVVMVDIKFTDWPGQWQHFSVPISEFGEDAFEDGFGFDGSSIRGWKTIDNSDMLVLPDPTTAIIDPFCGHPTLSILGDVVDPLTREPYSRDPRYIARKAVNYLKNSGMGDTIFVGPEAEFFIFDSARFETNSNSSFYEVDSVEGRWNSGAEDDGFGGPNLGYKHPHQAG